MTQKILYKTDKNSTKYYHNIDRCPRCGGTGIVEIYRPINGGDCFQCWGSGIIEYDTKEYTPEYEAKLEAQRQKREAKRMAKLQAELPAKKAAWLEKNGFNSEGISYLFLGNTYEIKDQLKELGAKFDYLLGWHIDHEVEGYQFITVNVNDIAFESMFDGYNLEPEKVWKLNLDSLKKSAYNAQNNIKASEYVGEVKDKIDIQVVLKFYTSFDSQFGVQTLYSFQDENNNIYVWKTANWLGIEKGTKVNLKGTIKDHKEYKGEKQTILTRCKVEITK
jgi:hypothetical protein